MSDDFSSVPTVDYSRLQNEGEKTEELLKLQDALFRVGFLYLINHGVERQVENLHSSLPSVFSMPSDEKERINMINSPSFVGYTALGAETTAKKTDKREQFDFGSAASSAWHDGDEEWNKLHGPSQFPALPGMKEQVQDYISTMERLSKTFLGYIAESLSLPADTFDDFLGNMHRLKLVKYPPSEPGSQGDDVGGLQVLSKSGVWIHAPPVPASFVVNIGQGFEAITGGICSATTHRVISPTSAVRYSIPFFQGVRLNLTLEQLKDSAAHIVARVPVADDKKKKAVDVPSEFLSPEYKCFGEAHLRNRIVSHPDVGKKWYADLYEKYVEQNPVSV